MILSPTGNDDECMILIPTAEELFLGVIDKDNVKEVDSYYSLYRYKVLYKYTYEFY